MFYHRFKQHREAAQGLVEYALILVLVAVVVIVVLLQLGPGLGNIFSNVIGVLENDRSASEVVAPSGPSGPCQVSHTDFGTATLPSSVRNGGDSGNWRWTGANLRYQSPGVNIVIYNGGWQNGASATGDCSPLG